MQIAIIGCGNMGRGIAQRLSSLHHLSLYDYHEEKSAALEQEGHGKRCIDIKEAVNGSHLVILAIKPQNLKEVAMMLAKEINPEQVVVSLLAGVSMQILKQVFSLPTIVRMMPNLALIYGEGVIACVSDNTLSMQKREHLTQLFSSLGKVYWLPEDKINAVTALTGSGPAFFFVMIEAMIEAGIAMGFSAIEAQDLIQKMVKGSLALLEHTSKHPGELKWQVTSPQGTTIAGLKTLEELALRGSIINTFLSAYERANTLALDACVHEQQKR